MCIPSKKITNLSIGDKICNYVITGILRAGRYNYTAVYKVKNKFGLHYVLKVTDDSEGKIMALINNYSIVNNLIQSPSEITDPIFNYEKRVLIILPLIKTLFS